MQKSDIKQKKIFVGVSWPYASGNVHIGHLAGQYVVCDIFSRYHRLRGNRVLMVSGSDSHGAAIELEAEKQEISPEKLVEKSHRQIVDTYRKLDFLYDNYTSTITENHKDIVQNIFLNLKENEFLFEKETLQYYDKSEKRFLPDRYVRGTCPKCKNNKARGDECPECGEFLSPDDLIEPYSTLSDTKPILKSTNHYYLDLKKTSKEVESWVKEVGKNWRKWVLTSTLGMIKVGLEPRPVTRDLKFGIPVPLKGWEEKRIYVWLEAVIGYLSASIEWSQKEGNPSLWEDFWKDPKCRHYYFIAGGNVPFHTIIWPSELIAYNKKYQQEDSYNKYLLPGESLRKPLNLPFNVPANKILMYKGKKMSKGDKTGITLEYLMESYNSDLIRFFCARYAPENHDREFVWKDFIDANNNELVANLGNFVNRVFTFTETKFNSQVPEGEFLPEIEEEINTAFDKCSKFIEKCEFIKATEVILNLGHFSNKYFNDQEPWDDYKKNITACQNTIYNSIQLANALRILMKPFMPKSSKKIAELLNIFEEYDPNAELEKAGRVTNFANFWVFTKIDAGSTIQEPEIVFQKLEYTEKLKEQDQHSVKEIAVSKGKDVNLIISPDVEHIPIHWKTFNNLKIKRKNHKVKQWINEITSKILEKYQRENWNEDEIFKKHRDLQRRYSKDKNIVSSSENLIMTIKEKGKIPNINTLVDIYNAVSALTGVSIGAHDIAKIEGDIEFKILEENSKFQMVGSKVVDTAKSGEYAYIDKQGIICRMDVKQADRTKITSKTQNTLIILQGNEALEKDDLIRATKLLEEGINLIKR
jgi:methionyl-tRNA synthetase